MSNFQTLLSKRSALMEGLLGDLLSDNALEVEVARPPKLMAAMRHSVLNGGKRLRPFLVIESARLFDVDLEKSALVGAALEFIHCYSLVHDDLPAMDDDDLRRGKPTTHKAFDEATAILAGDALLTLAFDVLSREETHENPLVRAELVNLFARNAGLGGMVGGQILDIEAETTTPDAMQITTMQSMKTGALLRCACVSGAVLGGATEGQRNAMLQFGNQIGNAFQLADDLLDVTATAEAMGKQTGKDADKGKGTLVSLYGIEEARRTLENILEHALESLDDFGAEADILRQTARFIVERKN